MKRSDVPTLEVLRLAAERWILIRTVRPTVDENGLLVYPPTLVQTLSAVYPPKVVRAKMEQMVSQDLLEYGTGLDSAWPTDKGWAMITASRND